MPVSYEGWVVCDHCGFLGDGYWRDNDDNTHEYFCPQCRKTYKLTHQEYENDSRSA